MNAPTTVCTTMPGNARYASLNAFVYTGTIFKRNGDWTNDFARQTVTKTTWTVTPAVASIKYGSIGNAAGDNQSLCVEFNAAGTYTFTATMISGGVTYTTTKVIKVETCDIPVCKGAPTTKAGFDETFGTAPTRTTSPYMLPSPTGYIANLTSDLSDNYYCIRKTTQGRSEWVNGPDHTGNTGVDGAMLVCNSAYEKKTFYSRQVTGMCTGAVYNFSAYIMNVNTKDILESGCALGLNQDGSQMVGYRYAGVTFLIIAPNGDTLKKFNTNDISMVLDANKPDKEAYEWTKYGGSFKLPAGVSSVTVKIVNNNPGGCGNDIAIDDISFQYCNPTMYGYVDGQPPEEFAPEVELCANAPVNIVAFCNPKNYFTNPTYTWEQSDNGTTWTPVVESSVIKGTSKDTLKFLVGGLQGDPTMQTVRYYRVSINEAGNSSDCTSPSERVKVTILPAPKVTVTEGDICRGQSTSITVDGSFDYYQWTNFPPGTPNTITVSPTDTTTYTVYGYKNYGLDANGEPRLCVDSGRAKVKVYQPPIVADITGGPAAICLGDKVNLAIDPSLSQFVVKWDPTNASTTAIEHTPTSIGNKTYKVTVTNVKCVTEKTFDVLVTAKPVANAGTNKDVKNCNDGTFQLAAQLNADEDGTWTIDGPDNGAVISDIHDKDAVVTDLGAGQSVTLIWTVKKKENGNCVSTDKIKLTNVLSPTISETTVLPPQCNNKVFAVTGNQPGPGETGLWELESGAATITNANQYNATVTLTGPTPSSAVVKWTISNATCTGAPAYLILKTQDPPNIAVASTIPVSCSSTGQFGVRLTSYSANITKYDIIATTPAMPGFTNVVDQPFVAGVNPIIVDYPTTTLPGTYGFKLVVKNDYPGCTKEVAFSVKVEAPPVTPTGIQVSSANICVSGSTTLKVTGGSLGKDANGNPIGQWKWYTTSCGGTPLVSDPTDPTGGTLTVVVSATTTFFVRAEGAGACATGQCVSTTVTVYAKPTVADAGGNQEHCEVDEFTMAANDPVAAGAEGTWTVVSSTYGLTLAPGEIHNRNMKVTVPAGDTAILKWTISNGGICAPTSADVTLINYKAAAPANAGTLQEHCEVSSFTLAANQPSVPSAVGTWTVVSSTFGLTLNAADIHKYNMQVTVPAGDTAILKWTITNGNCASSSANVTLINYKAAAAANAGTLQEHCEVPGFTLAANQPSVPSAVGTWTVVSSTFGLTLNAADIHKYNMQITVPAGDTAILKWTITNGNCASSSANVTLINYKAAAAANAGTLQEHCEVPGFTLAANQPSVPSAVGTWTVVSSTFGLTLNAVDIHKYNMQVNVPAGDTAILKWTITNGNCASSSANVTLINYKAAAAANAGPLQEHCEVPGFTLAANQPGVPSAVGTWTVVSSTFGLTLNAADIHKYNMQVTVPAGDTAILKWTITNGNCASSSANVTLINYKAAATANAGILQEHCEVPSFTLAANQPSVPSAVGTWTVVSSTFGLTLNTADIHKYNMPVTVPAGDTAILKWTITNGTCASSSADVTLINYKAAAAANAGTLQEHCEVPGFTLAANQPSVPSAVGTWTVVSSTFGLTLNAADIYKYNMQVTVPAGDTAILKWTITNGNCASSSANVTLINYKAAAAANAGTLQEHCEVPNFTLAANQPSVPSAAGTWTVVSSTFGLTLNAADIHKYNMQVTVPAGDTAILKWTITNGNCAASSANVTLINYKAAAAANAGTLQEHCEVPSFTLAANQPSVPSAVGTWTVVSSTFGLTLNAADIHKYNMQVTVPAGDTAILKWSITNGNCASSSANVTLINYKAAAAANAGPLQEHCEVASFTLAANQPGVPSAVGTWTVVSSTFGLTLNTADIHKYNMQVTVPAGDTAILKWTITNGNCASSSANVTLINYKAAAAANAGTLQEHCEVSSFTLAANQPSVPSAVGTWTVVSSTFGLTLNTADIHKYNMQVTVPAGDTAILKWTITNGNCASSSANVTLINYKAAAAANAGTLQEHCEVPGFTLAANQPSVPSAVGTWIVVSSTFGLTLNTADIHKYNMQVTVPAGDTAILKWTITNGTCASSSADVTLINYKAAAAANAGTLQEHCEVSSFTLAANQPNVPSAIGTWTVVSSTFGLTLNAADIHKYNMQVTVPAGDTAILKWTITNGNCASSSANVMLINYKAAATANAGTLQEHCEVPGFTLAANQPSVPSAVGTWTVVSSTFGLTLNAADIHKYNMQVTVPAGDTAILKWTITNGNCASSSANVTLINYKAAAAANAGTLQEHCEVPNFTLAANQPSVPSAVGTWTVVSSTFGLTLNAADIHKYNMQVTVPAGDTAILKWTITNGNCASSSANVTLINYKAAAAANAGTLQEHCEVSSFTLAANQPGVPSATGTWTVVSSTFGLTLNTADIHKYNMQVTVPAGDTAILKWTITNGNCASSSANVTLINYKAAAAANAGTLQEHCEVPNFTMAANQPSVPSATGTWTVVSSTFGLTLNTADIHKYNMQVTVPAGDTAILKWSITNGNCAASSANVTLINYKAAAAANAGPLQEHCEVASFTLAANQPGVPSATGTWTVVSSTFGLTLNTSDIHKYNMQVTVPAGDTAILKWTITNGNCASSSANVTLINYKAAAAANAGPLQEHCEVPGFTLAANQPSVPSATGTWTVVSSTFGLTLNTADIHMYNMPVTVPAGDTAILKWTITNGTCAATSANVTLINYKAAATANAGTLQEHCENPNFTLAANQPGVPSAVGTWTVVSSTFGLTLNPANIHKYNMQVVVPAGDTAILKWTITNGTCAATSANVTLINYKAAAAANAGTLQEHCEVSGFTLAANQPSVPSAVGTWTVVYSSFGLTLNTANIHKYNMQVSIPAGDTAILKWTITNGTCASSSANVTLINYKAAVAANAGTLQEHCEVSSFTLAANQPGVPSATGTWTVVSSTFGLTLNTSDIHKYNMQVTVPAGDTAILKWTITNGTCAATSANVTLINYKVAAAANAGPLQEHCEVPNFILAANQPGVPSAVGTWTVVSSTFGLTLNPANIHKYNMQVVVPAGDTAILKWTITNGTCAASSANVTLINYKAAAPANAGSLQEHCENPNFTLAANQPNVPSAVGTWTVVSSTFGLTLNAANIHKYNMQVTIPAGDTAILKWTITNGTCAATSANVTLINYKAAAAANAGTLQEHCENSNFTLAANQPNVPSAVGTWTVVSSTFGLTLNPVNIHKYNMQVVVPAGDTAILKWTITNGNCAATSANVTLINYKTAATANAGSLQEHCENPNFTLAANKPNVPSAVGTWTVVYSSYGLTINSTVSHQPNMKVVVPAGDTAILKWTITNGTCAATSANVTLINYKAAAVANAGKLQEHCEDPNFTMAANKPGVPSAIGTWTVVSSTFGLTINSGVSHDPNMKVVVPAGDTAILKWTITNGTCAATSANVTLINYKTAALANAGHDQEHCNDARFTMTANAPGVPSAVGTWKDVSRVTGRASIANIHSPVTVVTVPAGDTAILMWTITNGTCKSTSATVTLINNIMPVIVAAGPDQAHCNDAKFITAANKPDVKTAVGTWILTSTHTQPVSIKDKNNPVTEITVPAGEVAILKWSIKNGNCAAIEDYVTFTNLKPILGNAITKDQTVCKTEIPAALTSGTVTGGNGSYVYQWQRSTTGSNAGFSNIPGATSAVYQPGLLSVDTWFKRVITSGTCVNNISNVVKITVVQKPPVVISVPASITTACIQGKDYKVLFGIPEFSHHPYNDVPLTITHEDVTTPLGCNIKITRTWTAIDRCGLTTTASQSIIVEDKTAPVFTTTAPANVTVNCDAVPPAVNLTVKDDCNGILVITPVEVRRNLAGNCTNNYDLVRTWTSKDACGNIGVTLTQVVAVRSLIPPVFDMPIPADATVDCDKVPAGITLTATANCAMGTITVVPTEKREEIPGSKCADNYKIIRTWKAIDECGGITTKQQVITVQDTTKPVFSIAQPKDTLVDCDKVPVWPAVTAADNCSGAVKVTTSEKTVSLSATCAKNYQITRTWSAVDNCGNEVIMQQVITVQDTTKPVFVVKPPADTMVSCNAIPAPANYVTVSDNCTATNELKFTRSQRREALPGAICTNNYRLIRVWTVTDACGNTDSIRQIVTVMDTTRPVIMPAPADITIHCQDAIPPPVSLSATDNCDGSFPKNATYTEDPFVVDVCAGYTIIRRWRIQDACGNEAIERIQRVVIMPCPKPELDLTLPENCSDNPRVAIQVKGQVSRPVFTLVDVTPANAVRVPLVQYSNQFNLNGATSARFVVQDGSTGCVSDTATFEIKYNNKPTVNLGKDTTICGGNSLVLDAGAANFAYNIRWSTGATTQRIKVTEAGTYWVTVSNGICITTDTIQVGLVPTPLVDLPDTTICRGQSVKLNAYVDGAQYLWSNGTTSSSILVSTQEDFWVKVMKNGCITIDTIKVSVNPPPDISLSRDMEMCPDQAIMLSVSSNGGRIRWATGETTSSIVVTKPGGYWVTVSSDNCIVRDTVQVRLKPSIKVDLGPDREICPGGSITLNGSNPDAISYLWNDGDPNPVKEITQGGRYKLAVMDRFCNQVTMANVNVTVNGLPKINLGNDTVLCHGEQLLLRAEGGGITSARWQNGATGPTFEVTSSGTYNVTVFNECGSSTDQIEVGYIKCDPKPTFPNAFTPNGDGKNDFFKPTVRGPMFEYELRIFNRWGEMIYITSDTHKGWDGKYKGAPVDNGTYVWWLTFKKMPGGPANVMKGEVTVLR